MKPRECPEHTDTGLTPKDTTCHDHESDIQQRLHNLHCQGLGCQHALKGKERHGDVPLISPRNTLERLLRKLG